MEKINLKDPAVGEPHGRAMARREAVRRRNRRKRLISFFLLLFVSLILVKGGDLLFRFRDRQVSLDERNIGISDTAFTSGDIVNIMLFGVDDRKDGVKPRSDSMMVLTVDRKRQKVKVTSLMRDSYVEVKGHGRTKLNHAYAYGGPELALHTINTNFNLNITRFVTVDYEEMGGIIDALGGVTLEVGTEEELKEINTYIFDLTRVSGESPDYLKGLGRQTMSGMQAVSYSRIRKVGNGDFERTQRQRKVLAAIFDRITSRGPLGMPSMAADLMPLVTTNLTTKDILSLGSYVLRKGVEDIEQARFPLDTYSLGKTIRGTWYLDLDLEATAGQLKEYLYNDVKPVENHRKPFR